MAEPNLPQITIVTVTLNAGELLEETIKSVLEQTHSNYEYVLIDGGSTDGTLGVARQYESQITRILSEPDDGIYNAMNKGIRLSRGQWIYFLNAGDEFHERTTLEQVSGALTNNVDFLYGDRCRRSKEGALTRECAGKIENTFYKEVVYHQALFTRTALLKERPYNECYRSAADYEYVLYGYKTGKNFKYKPIVIANFLEGGVSSRNSIVTNIEATKASLDHIPEGLSIKKNYYLEKLVVTCFGYYLDLYLQASKSHDKHLSIRSETVGRSVRLIAVGGTLKLDQLLEGLNRELNDTNIVDQKSYDLHTLNRKKKEEEESCGQQTISQISSIPPAKKSRPSKVTVVTVSSNSADRIEKTIGSVLDQEYANIELIVVDSESADGTAAILEAYRDKISKILIEKTDGIYDAMNKGIDKADGDYVLFMHAGDAFCDRNIVGRIFSRQGEFEDMIYGDAIHVESDGELVYDEAKDLHTTYERIPYRLQSLFLKTDIIRKFRFNTEYKYSADYEQAIKLFDAGYTYKKVESPVCMIVRENEKESGVRLYIEATKIILDNCSDKTIIRKNHYLSKVREHASKLLDI